MQNPIADAIAELFGQAVRAHQGAALQTELLTLNPPESILDDYSAASAAQGEFVAASGALSPLNAALTVASTNGYAWAQTAKDVLKKYCGRSFGQKWIATGFSSLEVPRSQDGIRALLVSLQAHLKKNPDRENERLEVTAVQAGKLAKAMEDARNEVMKQESVLAARKAARDAAVDALKARLRGLIGELRQVIGTGDARWRNFGFNIPDEPETPGQPVNVTVNNATPGQLLVACDAVPWAARYRFWKQGIGSALEPVAAGTSAEPVCVIEDLPGGEKFNIFVSAVNETGREGVRSVPAEAQTLPTAAVA